jgi:hypothetical protein
MVLSKHILCFILVSCTWGGVLGSGGTTLNIHIKLEDAESAAIALNSAITRNAPGNEIDLKLKQQPHVTLYLTEFEGASGQGWYVCCRPGACKQVQNGKN